MINIISNPDISIPKKDRDNTTTKDINTKEYTRFRVTVKAANRALYLTKAEKETVK